MNTIATPPVLEHLSALGDETRTRLLALLESGEFNVSELCQALQLPQPTVSRHLRTLADDGWLLVRTEGRMRHYRMAEDLDPIHRSLWTVVRESLQSFPAYARDDERAHQVLAHRKRRSAEFFAASADRWTELRRDLFGARAEFSPLLGLLDPAWTVADLGTGTGALAETVAPFVSRVVGVDRSSAMLEAAGERLSHLDNAELREGDLEALPLVDGEADLAVLSLVLHYVVEPLDVLREARRVLTGRGRLLIIDMQAHERGPRYAEEMGHVWPGFDPGTLRSWLEAAGFQGVTVRPLPPDPEAQGPRLFVATARKP